MLVQGRGAIATVEYSGDEAAPEIKKLLDALAADEDSFERWTELVDRASNLEGGVTRNSSPSAIELVRNVYDCFLAKFPLFFGYWKKYADLEFNIGGTETAEMVYERGVSCIPNSVDLWTHYCNFKMDTCHDNDIIRDLFERGSEFVGLDYQSHPFWDKYIEFEERLGDKSRLTKIYERLVHQIIWALQRYYAKFRHCLTERPLEELTDEATLESAKAYVLEQAPGILERSEIEFDRAVRNRLDHIYYEINVTVNAEVHKRWAFETAIKRPYFHVTDNVPEELENWRNYLDFEENEGDYKRIVALYERCLVTCALHEEFWLRYARWMFAQGKDEDTRAIYMRASCIFVPIAQPTIRLHWARFEEKLGSIPMARDIHVGILDQLPDHVETIISLAGLERRNEGIEAAVECLEGYINQRDITIAGQLTVEQARILWQCGGNVDRARKLFADSYVKYPGSEEFWIGYLQFEMNQLPADQDEAHDRVKGVYDLMRSKGGFSESELKALSQHYMNYLLDRGGKKAAEEYMRLDNELNGARPLPQNQHKEDTAEETKTAPVETAASAVAATSAEAPTSAEAATSAEAQEVPTEAMDVSTNGNE